MKQTNLVVKSFILIGLLVLSATAAKSQSVTIKILSIQGSVEITRPQSLGIRFVKLSATAELVAGDIIKTNSNGRVVLKLSDNSQAIISEKTTVEIKDTSSSPRTIFNVLRGKTRIKIEKLGGRPNPYRVTTPTTVIAVRGTEFDVIVKDDDTKVYVHEGEVSVTSIKFSQEIILTPGNFTQVRGNQPPQPPAQFKPEQNDKFFQPKDTGQGENNPNNKDGKPNSAGGEPPKNNQTGKSPPSTPPNSTPSPTQGGQQPPPPKKPF